MTQSSFSLPNTPGATFRSNNNTALQALATFSSGASAPSITYAGMYWWDQTANLIKQRNGANTAWITVQSFDGSTVIPYRAGTALGLAAVEAVAAGGSAGLLRADGDGSSLTGISAGFRGTIDGLILSNNGSQAIDIGAGQARDSGNAANLSLATALVNKQLNNNWAVGPAAGMLDTGSIAADTWYHIHGIRRPDTGVTDVLASLSATAPTMPTNYTQKRRIGAVLTDGVPNIVGFFQHGSRFYWKTRRNDHSLTSVDTGTRGLYAVSVPTGIPVIVKALISVEQSNSNVVIVTCPQEDDLAPSKAIAPGYSGICINSVEDSPGDIEVLTDSSAQVGLRGNVSGIDLEWFTQGWIDPRGRDS